MGEPVIEVRDCGFGYHKSTLLHGVDMRVEQGEFAGIIGSNGAGKSTLLRLLLGELTARTGEILLFGTPVQSFRSWPMIGYVPQNAMGHAAGFPASAAEVVAAGLYTGRVWNRIPRRELRERVAEALSAVEMGDMAGELVGELSGGQLQRVLIARALAARPRLLLLDEPVTGLDAQHAQALYNLLRGLQVSGLTILMVTHDISRAADYLGSCYCLEEGSMVRLEPEQLALELRHRHRHPHSQNG